MNNCVLSNSCSNLQTRVRFTFKKYLKYIFQNLWKIEFKIFIKIFYKIGILNKVFKIL